MSESKSGAALRAVLQTHTAADCWSDPKGGVVELDSTMSTVDAAKKLWEANILGAPVWDESKGEYLGFFDMRDILSAVVACAGVKKDDDQGADGDEKGALFSKYNTHMVAEMEKIGEAAKKETSAGEDEGIAHVSYLARRNPFHSVPPTSTLEDLCKVLTLKKCHRVPIINGDSGKKCRGIVSQSALVKFLSTHVAKDGALEETLEQAGLAYTKDVISILDEASATDAFRLLDSHRLSGIAVIDEDGKLVGNTSARDIKLAALDEGRTSIDTDILSYLANVRQATPTKKERYPSCHVHEDSTVGHVVNLLAKTGYHRVFVVNEKIEPVGVISVADILKFALEI